MATQDVTRAAALMPSELSRLLVSGQRILSGVGAILLNASPVAGNRGSKQCARADWRREAGGAAAVLAAVVALPTTRNDPSPLGEGGAAAVASMLSCAGVLPAGESSAFLGQPIHATLPHPLAVGAV